MSKRIYPEPITQLPPQPQPEISNLGSSKRKARSQLQINIPRRSDEDVGRKSSFGGVEGEEVVKGSGMVMSRSVDMLVGFEIVIGTCVCALVLIIICYFEFEIGDEKRENDGG